MKTYTEAVKRSTHIIRHFEGKRLVARDEPCHKRPTLKQTAKQTVMKERFRLGDMLAARGIYSNARLAILIPEEGHKYDSLRSAVAKECAASDMEPMTDSRLDSCEKTIREYLSQEPGTPLHYVGRDLSGVNDPVWLTNEDETEWAQVNGTLHAMVTYYHPTAVPTLYEDDDYVVYCLPNDDRVAVLMMCVADDKTYDYGPPQVVETRPMLQPAYEAGDIRRVTVKIGKSRSVSGRMRKYVTFRCHGTHSEAYLEKHDKNGVSLTIHGTDYVRWYKDWKDGEEAVTRIANAATHIDMLSRGYASKGVLAFSGTNVARVTNLPQEEPALA